MQSKHARHPVASQANHGISGLSGAESNPSTKKDDSRTHPTHPSFVASPLFAARCVDLKLQSSEVHEYTNRGWGTLSCLWYIQGSNSPDTPSFVPNSEKATLSNWFLQASHKSNSFIIDAHQH